MVSVLNRFLQGSPDKEQQYNPKRFAAVIMRIREPKTTALIFASGKMVVTGAKSEDDSKLASRKYARIIQKLGFNAKFTDFKIQNIVGSCDIKFPIRLEGLASKHHNFSSYEPELFPGLIYRMIKPKIVLLIFVSGKIVLTGAKVREEIYQAFEMIYPVLQGWFPCLHPLLPTCMLTITTRFPQGLSLRNLAVMVDIIPTDNSLHPHDTITAQLCRRIVHYTPSTTGDDFTTNHTHQKTRPTALRHQQRLRLGHLYHFCAFSFSFSTSQHCTGVHGRGRNIKAGFFALFLIPADPEDFGAGALRLGYSTHRKIAHDMAGAAVETPHTHGLPVLMSLRRDTALGPRTATKREIWGDGS